MQYSTPPASKSSSSSGVVATLGPSIVIKGNLTGEEDLVIQGRVSGEVRLTKNNVTVGENGHIKADIHGKSVRVEGEVEGNLYGGEEVVIRASGRVRGNIVSPRVTLENGSKFKGAIDMEPAGKSNQAAAPRPESAPKKSTVNAGPAAKPAAASTS